MDNILDVLNERGVGRLPGLIGMRFTSWERDRVEGELQIRDELLAPNGYLHAGTVTTFADTLCGYGTRESLPEGASGYTTIELKNNMMATATEGLLKGVATPVHRGRSSQVWDARIWNPQNDKTLCLFRCTQMILWPR